MFGLDDCVAKLKTLLGRESRFSNCGVLLYGPPDSGKKTLANALATEFQARFVCLDCAALVSKLAMGDLEYLGETFKCILTLKPCVMLLEGIEVVPRGFECSELGFTVLQAIQDLLDHASSNPKLVIVCSTTLPQNVDDSLLMRLSEKIYVPLPSETTRSRIFMDRLRLSTTSSEAEKFVKALVSRTSGCSVAQLLELCLELEHVKKVDYDAQSCTVDMHQRLETVSLSWLSEHVARTLPESAESSANYFVKQNDVQGSKAFQLLRICGTVMIMHMVSLVSDTSRPIEQCRFYVNYVMLM